MSEHLGIELVIEKVTADPSTLKEDIAKVVKTLESAVSSVDIFKNIKDHIGGFGSVLKTLDESFSKLSTGITGLKLSLDSASGNLSKFDSGASTSSKNISDLTNNTKTLQAELSKGFTFKMNASSGKSAVDVITDEKKKMEQAFKELQEVAKKGAILPISFGDKNKDNNLGKLYNQLQTAAAEARSAILSSEKAKATANLVTANRNIDKYTASEDYSKVDTWTKRAKVASDALAELQAKATASTEVSAFKLLGSFDSATANNSMTQKLAFLKAIGQELVKLTGIPLPKIFDTGVVTNPSEVKVNRFRRSPAYGDWNNKVTPYINVPPSVPPITTVATQVTGPAVSPIATVAAQVAKDATKKLEETGVTAKDTTKEVTRLANLLEFSTNQKNSNLENKKKIFEDIGIAAGLTTKQVAELEKSFKGGVSVDKFLKDLRKMEVPQDSHVAAYNKTASVAVGNEDARLEMAKQQKKIDDDAAKAKDDKEINANRIIIRDAEARRGIQAKADKEALSEEQKAHTAKIGVLNAQLSTIRQTRVDAEKATTTAEINANTLLIRDAEGKRGVARDNQRKADATAITTDKFVGKDIQSKDFLRSINNTSATHPTLDVSNARGLQAELSALIAGGGGKVELSAITTKARELTSAIAQLKEAAKGQTTTDPFKNMFSGMAVATTTIQELDNKVKALYGDLTKLDSQQLGNINRQLKGYTAELKNGSVAAKEASGWTKLFGDSIGKMAARLTEFYGLRAIILSVGNQFRDAISSALDLNQAVHDIIAISGDSSSNYGTISKSIYDIAKASRYSAVEVAGLMQVLAQAGVAAESLPTVSKQVGAFATATNAKPEQAADLVTTSLNVYDLKITETSRITNTLTAALNKSKLEVSGLATAFNYLAPQAAQLGMSLEQTAAIIATMAQSGIKASTIGTGTSQLLKELTAPKKRLADMLASKQIDGKALTTDQVDPTKHDFADIVDTLNKANVSVDDLFKALESRVGRAALTAVNLGGDAFREMTLNVTGTRAALIAYEESMQGARARMNVLKQSVNETASSIGDLLAPVLIQVVEQVQTLTNILGSSGGKWIVYTTGVVAATAALASLGKMSTWVMGINAAASIGSTFSGIAVSATRLLGTFEAVKLGFMSLGGAMSALIPTSLVVAGVIAAVGAAVYGVIYLLGAEERAAKAKNKEILESIAGNERLESTYNALATSNKGLTTANEAYHKAIKAGKSETQAYEAASKIKVELSDKERTSIMKLISEDGPYAKKLKALMEEGNQYKILIELQKIYLNGQNSTTQKDIQTFNAEDKKSRKAAVIEAYGGGHTGQQAATKAGLLGVTNDGTGYRTDINDTKFNAILASDGKEAKNLKQLLNKEQEKNALQKAAKERIQNGAVEKNDEGVVTKNWYIDPKTQQPAFLAPSATKVPKRSDYTGSTHKKDPEIYKEEYTYLKNLKAERAELLSELGISGQTAEELRVEYNKIQDIESKLAVAMEGKARADADLEAMDSTKKTRTFKVGYFEKAEGALEKGNSNYNPQWIKYWNEQKANLEKAYTKPREAMSMGYLQFNQDTAADTASKELEKSKNETTKKNEGLVKVRTDAEKKYTDNVLKIVKDEAKRLSELEKVALDGIIASAYVDEATRGKAVNAATLEAKKVTQAEFLEKVKELATAYGDGKAQGLYDIETLRALRDKGIATARSTRNSKDLTAERTVDTKASTGYFAAIDRKTENDKRELERSKEKLYDAQKIREVELAASKVDETANEKKITYLNEQKKLYGDQIKEKKAWEESATIEERLLLGINTQLDEQLVKRKQLTAEQKKLNESALDSFRRGAGEAWTQQTDINAQSKQLGGNLVNTGVNGVTDSLVSSMNTFANPDKDKVNSLKADIAQLNTQKAQLTGDIAAIEGNSSKTPAEVKALADKKLALDGINSSLSAQNKALKEQTNAWSSFAAGLKKVMVSILEELQKYIVKLLVVAMAKQLAGMLFNAVGGSLNTTENNFLTNALGSASGAKMVTPKANGGIIQGLATGGTVLNAIPGGFLPTDKGFKMGVDSVPIMGMPGEFMIKKSSVDFYGRDFFEKANAQKLATGGSVGGGSSATKSSEAKQEFTLQIVNITQGDQVPQQGDNSQQIINVINADIARKGPTYKTIKSAVSG